MLTICHQTHQLHRILLEFIFNFIICILLKYHWQRFRYTARWFSFIHTCIYICIFFHRFFSVLGCYMILNIFPRAIHCVYFYFVYSSMYLLIANSQFILHLSPLITISLFSMSVVYFCFENKFICIHRLCFWMCLKFSLQIKKKTGLSSQL